MPSLTKIQSGFMEAQGALPLSPGTAAAPGLKFDDHAGTGMFSPSTGEIAFSTSGKSQAITFKTDGKVGIGTDNPGRALQISQANSTAYSGTDFDQNYHVLKLNNTTDSKTVGMQFLIGSNGEAAITATETSDGATDLIFGTRGSGSKAERVRVTSAGNLITGSGGTSESIGGGAAHIQSNENLSILRRGNVSSGPYLNLAKSRNATPGSFTIVQDNDYIGSIGFCADDGTDINHPVAYIHGRVNGTPGANDVPGMLTFATTPDGGVQPLERLRITSAGKIGVGGAPASWDSSTTSTVLQVKNSHFFDYNGAQLDVGHNYHYDGSNYKYTTTGYAGRMTFHKSDGTIRFWTLGTGSADANVTLSERLRIDSNGRILVGPGAIATPKCGYAGIDVPNYDYSIVMGGSDQFGNRVDNTNKDGKFCGAHYVNAEEPVGIIRYSMGSTASELHMGGGSSLVNAATQLSFWTAANTTTTTGSERLRITSAGAINIGKGDETTSAANLVEMYVGATDESYATIRGKYNRTNEYNRSEVRFGVENNGSGLGFLAFATGNNSATERVRIASDGKLTAKSTHSNGAVNEALRITTLGAYSSSNSSNAGPAISFGQFDGDYPTWTTAQIAGIRKGTNWHGALAVYTNDGGSETDITEKLRITSAGQLLVNTTTSRSFSDNSGNGPTPAIQIEATNSSAIMSIVAASTADSHRAGTINLGRHRNTNVGGTPTVVNNGDTLGAVCFSGGDGSDMLSVAAHIRGLVDGTPGSNDMPGALSFSTTPDGSSSPYNQERMRITSAGLVGINEDQPVGRVYIAGINSSTFGVAADGALNLGAPNGALVGRRVNLNFTVVPSAANAVGTIAFEYTNQSNYGKGDLIFGTRNVNTDTAPTERLRITSDGQLSFGTSSALGRYTFYNAGSSGSDAASDGDTGMYVKSDMGPTHVDLTGVDNYTMQLSNGAYAGSGISDPQGTITKLLFHGCSHNGWNNYGALCFDVQGTSGGKGDFTFIAGGSERLRITYDGNVGIGLDDPQHLLHLNKGTSATTSYKDATILNIRGTNNANVMAGIGFGYSTSNPSSSAYPSAWIGAKVSSWTSYVKHDLIFATRDVDTNTEPEERFRITEHGELIQDYNSQYTQRGLSSTSRSGQDATNTPALATTQSYGFGYQESFSTNGGTWVSPYPNLVLGYHTGVSIGGHLSYEGTRFYADHPSRTSTILMSVGNGNYNVHVTNTLTAGTKTFRIAHPHPSKKWTHDLVHSVIEGPQCDNIYRGKVDLVNGTASINIDTVSNMTDGTFVLLNRDIQCFTSNETGWTAVKGSVSGNILTITAKSSSCTDTISWMVIGERQDDKIKSPEIETTDSDGKLITEPLTIEETHM